MTIGLYAVVNTINHKAYVGSSDNVERRLRHHKCFIKNHNFRYYQGYAEDAIKYGVDAFEFKLLKQTDTIEEAKELETAFLECFIDGLYNKAPHSDGATGIRRNRDAYIAGAAKRLQDPEYTKKISNACKGKRALVTCPHCNLTGGGGNMRRYHFDKCASKK
jgi:group I intron endonuclease